MKDEQKLRSFTGPLVGYEASGRVVVAIETTNRTGEKGHTILLDTVSDKFSQDLMLTGQEVARTLRATTSDSELKKPLWASPVRSRKIAPIASLEIKQPDRSFLRSADTNNPQLSERGSSPSSEMSTSSLGAVGDGWLAASSQLLPNSGHSMGQNGRKFERIDYLQGGSSIKTTSRLSDLPTSQYSQRGLQSMNLNTDNAISSFESFAPLHVALGPSQLSESSGIRHGMGHNDSDPPSLTDIGPSSVRRVYQAPLPSNSSSPAKHSAEEAIKVLFKQNHARLATNTVDAIELAISRRQNFRYTLPTPNADQDVNRASSRTNVVEIPSSPRIFSLPSAVGGIQTSTLGSHLC